MTYQFIESEVFPGRVAAIATRWEETPDGILPVEMFGIYGRDEENVRQVLFVQLTRQVEERWGIS